MRARLRDMSHLRRSARLLLLIGLAAVCPRALPSAVAQDGSTLVTYRSSAGSVLEESVSVQTRRFVPNETLDTYLGDYGRWNRALVKATNFRAVEHSESEIIYEMRRPAAPFGVRYELGRILFRDGEFLHISYRASVDQLPDSARAEWLNLLRAAKVIPRK